MPQPARRGLDLMPPAAHVDVDERCLHVRNANGAARTRQPNVQTGAARPGSDAPTRVHGRARGSRRARMSSRDEQSEPAALPRADVPRDLLLRLGRFPRKCLTRFRPRIVRARDACADPSRDALACATRAHFDPFDSRFDSMATTGDARTAHPRGTEALALNAPRLETGARRSYSAPLNDADNFASRSCFATAVLERFREICEPCTVVRLHHVERDRLTTGDEQGRLVGRARGDHLVDGVVPRDGKIGG